jgi:predicted nicotinamide N-methyase
LGVPYLRAQQETVRIELKHGKSMTLHQSSLGLMAISGVVWDAGLLLIDYLVDRDKELGRVVDLGCGTGVCGICALLLGAAEVAFSDKCETPCLEDNLTGLEDSLRLRSAFVEQDWATLSYTPNLLSPIVAEGAPVDSEVSSIDTGGENSGLPSTSESSRWDTVLCSDLLYEQKAHEPLLRLLRQMNFKEAIFAYKRRHDEPERLFFEKLSDFCVLAVVKPADVRLKNLTATSTAGLYIIVATKMALPTVS